MENWTFPPGGGHTEMPSKIYCQTMTKKDIEERLKVNDILLIPFGSTENHGDAQPFGEDAFIVTRMCEMIAQKTGCSVAEPLWYASHPKGVHGPYADRRGKKWMVNLLRTGRMRGTIREMFAVKIEFGGGNEQTQDL